MPHKREIVLKDNTDIQEFTENYMLRASIDSCISLIAMSVPLFQIQAVSMIRDSIIRMQMNKIILYTEIKETACIAKYCLLPCLLPSVHSCKLIKVKCAVNHALKQLTFYSEIPQTSILLQDGFHLEHTGWLQYHSQQDFKLTPLLKMLGSTKKIHSFVHQHKNLTYGFERSLAKVSFTGSN